MTMLIHAPLLYVWLHTGGGGGKSAHYGSEQSSYYSITAWLTKVVGQD